jgi:hypothetical protein
MTRHIHGYAYVEVRFRDDHIGPGATTRAPAGEPPDIRRLTWVAADERQSASDRP